MGDSHNWKPGSRPGRPTPPARNPAAGDKPEAVCAKPADLADAFAGKSGRVIHDERGNAVWDWIKETSRIAVDSTSRLLKRLEVPELKMEDTQPNQELSLESDRDPGGGYNPYGGSTPGKAAEYRGGTGSGGAGGSSGARGDGLLGGRDSRNSGSSNLGGGYDPYGKSVPRKPARKP
jgi:hypothetical protein